MIQDIAPYVYDNAFAHRREARPDDYVLFTRNGKEVLLAEKEDGIHLPTVAETGTEGLRFAFLIGETAFFLGEEGREMDGFAYVNQAGFRSLKPQHLSFACITGLQLARWYRSRRFCGYCGAPMTESENERALVCTACHRIEYPKIMPCVIVAITHGDKLLVTHYADRPLTSYALVAGFCEIGESVEETVKREVMEEVGLKVKNLRFYKSQPWSFTDTLLMGFFCELDGEDETIRLDTHELKEGVWLRRDELPVRRGEASLTAEMMEMFRIGKER